MKKVISYSLLALLIFLSVYINRAFSCDVRVEHHGTVIQNSKFFSTFTVSPYNTTSNTSLIFFEYKVHYVSENGHDLVERGVVREYVDSNSTETIVDENPCMHDPQTVLGVEISNISCSD